MTIYRAVKEPPEDNRALLCAWRIEKALINFDKAYDYYDDEMKRRQTYAAATVQIVTGYSREASRDALLNLLAHQAAIATTLAADGKTYEQAYGENVAAYESELMRLAYLGVRS